MEREVCYNGIVAYDGGGDVSGSMVAGGDTLEEALTRLFKSGTYYVGLGYTVAIRNVEMFCCRCNGSGNVQKGKNAFRFVKCPMCKGRDSRRIVLGSIPVELSGQVGVVMK